MLLAPAPDAERQRTEHPKPAAATLWATEHSWVTDRGLGRRRASHLRPVSRLPQGFEHRGYRRVGGMLDIDGARLQLDVYLRDAGHGPERGGDVANARGAAHAADVEDGIEMGHVVFSFGTDFGALLWRRTHAGCFTRGRAVLSAKRAHAVMPRPSRRQL